MAKNAEAYARHVLDALFTKSEQKKSLIYKSGKSDKPPLDEERIAKLFGELQSHDDVLHLGIWGWAYKYLTQVTSPF